MTATASPRRLPARRAVDVINVIAHSPESLEAALDHAEAQVRTAAVTDRRGTRITRRSVSLFTVEAAADVPHGTTVEIDCWQRPTGTRPRAAGDEAVL
jgi:hypothetical protein